jgi:hypothetical protein
MPAKRKPPAPVPYLGLSRAFVSAGTVSASVWRENNGPGAIAPPGMLAGLLAEAAASLGYPEYERFKRQYRTDPIAFVHDVFRFEPNESPTFYQERILTAIIEHQRVSVRSPHGAGKSTTAAWLILWFALTRDGEDWKVPTTASAWRQLDKFLWPEVHKWARRLRWDKIGRPAWAEGRELLDLDIKLSTGQAFATASNDPARLEGAHADELLYLIDEGKNVPAPIFDAIEGAFAGAGNAYAGVWSTPGEPLGRFYDIQARKPGFEDWHVIRITLEDCIRAGRIKPEWAEQRRLAWGQDSAIYKNRVLGDFATSDTDGIVPLEFVEAANERWRAWQASGAAKPAFTCLGVDVGGGGDKSSVAHRYDWLIERVEKRNTPNTMTLVGWVYGLLQKLGGYANVDIIGIGAGTVHRLQELLARKKDENDLPVRRARAYGFNASKKSFRKDASSEMGFANLRAEGWWTLRELLDPALGAELALPPDAELTGDLTAGHYRMVSGGRIQVEEKDAIRARLGRSPDLGDAVMQACINVDSVRGPAASILQHYLARHQAQLEQQAAEQPVATT